MAVDYSLVMPVDRSECVVNGRAKIAPDGSVIELVYSSRPVFCTAALEERGPAKRRAAGRQKEDSDRSAGRARKRLFELARCNDFDLFVTLTLSREKIADRYDPKVIIPKLNTWLDNRVRRHGLRYVIVPERHKDGALHFHGLVNADALRLQDSGRTYRKDGRTVYNLPDWKYGFSTAMRLTGEYEGVCRYISKYITKQTGEDGMIAGRYFYSGGDLQRARQVLFEWEEKPDGREVEIAGAGLTMVYVNVTQLAKCRRLSFGAD